MNAGDVDAAGIADIRRTSSVGKHDYRDEKQPYPVEGAVSSIGSEDEVEPTEEEMRTLRRVSGKIPWQAYTVTFVEFVSCPLRVHTLHSKHSNTNHCAG